MMNLWIHQYLKNIILIRRIHLTEIRLADFYSTCSFIFSWSSFQKDNCKSWEILIHSANWFFGKVKLCRKYFPRALNKLKHIYFDSKIWIYLKKSCREKPQKKYIQYDFLLWRGFSEIRVKYTAWIFYRYTTHKICLKYGALEQIGGKCRIKWSKYSQWNWI